MSHLGVMIGAVVNGADQKPVWPPCAAKGEEQG